MVGINQFLFTAMMIFRALISNSENEQQIAEVSYMVCTHVICFRSIYHTDMDHLTITQHEAWCVMQSLARTEPPRRVRK